MSPDPSPFNSASYRYAAWTTKPYGDSKQFNLRITCSRRILPEAVCENLVVIGKRFGGIRRVFD